MPPTEAPAKPGSSTEPGTEEAKNSASGSTPPTPPADLGREPDPQPDDLAPEDGLFLTGPYEVGTKVKGNKPEGAVLKLKGGKVELGKSQFNRGERFPVLAIVQVTGDNDQDTIDKLSGDVKSTSKAQSATVCQTALLQEFLASQIEDDQLVARVCVELGLPMPERLENDAA